MRFLLLFLISLCQLSFSQSLVIKDAKTNTPLEFVSVVDSAKNITIASDAKGQVQLEHFKGTDGIQIRFLGYKTQIHSYSGLVQLKGELLLQKETFNLNPVVISATRWKQNKGDVSSKIISIKKKDFLFHNPQTAADLLGTSGQIFIQKSQQGGGSPMIRGFSANRLLYSVDGIRMNTAIFRSGNLQNVISLDPYAVENTEVLFGPGSVIYGSDAIGGVMSFTTLTPELSTNDSLFIRGNAAMRFASANTEQTFHLDLNFGGSKVSFLSSLTQSDYGDLRMGKNGPEEYKRDFVVERRGNEDLILNNNDRTLQLPTQYSQLNFMQKIRFKPNKHWDINYGFHFSETTEFDRYDRLVQLRNDTPRYAEWKYGPQKWTMNMFDIRYSKKSKLFDQFSIRLAYQNFEESRINRNLNDSIRTERIEEVDAYSINLDFTKQLNSRHQLFYGIEGIFNQVNSNGKEKNILTNSGGRTSSRYPKSDWYTYAFYLTEQFNLNEKWVLNTGLRHSWYAIDSKFDTSLFSLPFTTAEVNNSALNGNIGVVYRPSSSFILSSNASTGFRAPNVDDIGKIFDSEPFSVVVPNPNLKAEYAYNFDIGLIKTFNETVKIDITTYYTFLENALVRRDFQLNEQDSILYEGELSQVQAIQNAAKSFIYGLQFGIELRINQNFSFSSQLNYQKGEEELDNGSTSPSRHTAPLFGISQVTYEKNKIKLQLYSDYSGEIANKDLNTGERSKTHIYAIDNEGNNFSPAWYTINLKGQYRINRNINLSLGLENISNQRYRTYSSGIAAAGRNLSIAANAKF